MSGSTKRPSWVLPTISGVVGTLLVAGLLAIPLGVAPILAGAIGLIVGGGLALVSTPFAPKMLEILEVQPTTVPGMLEAARKSADGMEQAMRRLTSRHLWASSALDERIAGMIGQIRTLSNTPALQKRAAADGDVHMLYVLATDYLPTIVNLAIENDRMHTAFRSGSSRAEVERNIASLEEQAGVLGEAFERIETDVVRGTTSDIQQHAAFLRSRFEQMGATSVLDLSQPLDPQTQPTSGKDAQK